ncbi:MAG: hypothetical protein CMI79_05735 [Candidatus Pelagibacter sp.]|nr:hypothetical protein [Candidatus Pelagibacter sp.]|tara:strand:+ start:14251 stop:15987 length:1737 start_codon:yes stop_codon:yes gene_type:complete
MNVFSKVHPILSGKDRTKFNMIILLNFVIFFLEFISLASIPLFVSIIIDPSLLLNKINEFFTIDIIPKFSNKILISIGAIFVISTFLFKNSFLIFHTYLQGKFFKNLKIDIATKLFTYYTNSPYLFHLTKNPSELSRNVSSEIQNAYGYMFHLIAFTRESLTILVIFSLLLIVNPLITFFTSIFFCMLIIIYLKKVKPLIRKRAIQNQDLQKSITQTVYETFGAIKDLKILSKENEIREHFKNKIDNLEDNTYFFSFYEKYPRIFLELISIITIILASLIYLSLNPNFINIIPILTLLVISFVRFIPAFGAITLSITYMKNFEPSIELINKEISKIGSSTINSTEIKNKVNKNLKFTNKKDFLLLDNISFSYPDSEIFPIKNINLSIDENSKVGITGKTGAGKSTLFHLMLGLLTPKSGNIFYKGQNIFNNLEKWRKEIGYISQNVYLLDSTIKKNIAFNFLDEPVDEKKIIKAIEIADLKEKISYLPNGVNTKVGTDGLKLSGGERQRIALARAVYREPNIFFMDESTSALDSKTEETIIQNIKNNFKHKTMIMIAHRQSTIKSCDKILNLKDGKIS